MPRAELLLALLLLAARLSAQDAVIEAQQAKQAMLAGRYSEAVALYRKLAAQLPEEPSVQFNLALALHSLGHFAESTKILEGIQASAEDNPKYWFLLGEGYLRLGDAKEAVAPLTRAEALSPASFGISKELASAYLQSGRLAEAGERFRSLAETHPEQAEIWASLALSEMELGNREQAQQARAHLTTLPDSAEKFQLLARLDSTAGHGADAIRDLRAAARLRPQDSGIQGQLARALISNREFEEAATLLAKLLAGGSGNVAWQFDYGDALLQLGKPEEAIPHLRQAVALSPGLLPAQAKLGEALLQTGAAAGAIGPLELAAPLDKDGSIHFQLATAYRRSGKPELAARAAATSKLLSKQPQ